LVAQPDQLVVDAPVAQVAFSDARRNTNARIAVTTLGRPGRRGQVQRRATRLRCQRSNVAGRTKNVDHHGCGSSLDNAANKPDRLAPDPGG